MSHSITAPPRAWAEINLSALLKNLAFIKQHSNQAVMAVLKAGAYGHGIEAIASALDNQNLAYFGVASVIEARKLTQAQINTPIYLLGPTFPEERPEIVHNRWTPCISSIDEAEHFNQLNSGNTPIVVHITVDTGMGRGGFLPMALPGAISRIQQLPNIQIEGIGSHLPSADEDRDFTLKQFASFEAAVRSNKAKYIHLSNSAGLLDYSNTATNLVRPGLMLYGISPIPKYQHHLSPVMTLKSRVSLVRTLPAGHGISYGRDTILDQDTRVATIGIGYGDGYPRAVSNTNAKVRIRGTLCPLLGRVTMDQIMVDVSKLPDCTPGDEVELFGPNILVSDIAKAANTIPWEVLTGITPRVTRTYTTS
ncbi:alanine racemase [Rubritalea tangerina]|uniref:Alanine racemase n=1 Tax=Rubritalea tangerina TaxID=430798 RepID=A0ABW4Z8B4_9BACT